MRIKFVHCLVCCLSISWAAFSQDATYTLTSDVVWATPDGMELTMDIYMPNTGQASYPVLTIFHGGGWLINNKSIMDQMSQYVAAQGKYVVCNVNYRLLVDQQNTVTMNQIVEDALGAVLWVQSNIAQYKGDPKNVAVTGDSAGGHLAEMVVVAGQMLSESKFDKKPYGYLPTYMPSGVTVKQLKKNGGVKVQAAVISYGAFDIYASCMGGFEKPSNFFWQMGGVQARSVLGGEINAVDNADMYQVLSPSYLIPETKTRQLPKQLFMVGSKDNTTTPESVSAYVDKLKAAGQPTQYWVNEGRPHAFMDSGANEYLGIQFEKDAIPALEVIMPFLDSVFYPSEK